MRPRPRPRPFLPRADRGWLLAGQVILAFLAVLYPQLGARESASSILPPLRVPVEAFGPSRDVDEGQPRDGDLEAHGQVAVAVAVPGPINPPPASDGAPRLDLSDEPTATGRPASSPSRAPPPLS